MRHRSSREAPSHSHDRSSWIDRTLASYTTPCFHDPVGSRVASLARGPVAPTGRSDGAQLGVALVPKGPSPGPDNERDPGNVLDARVKMTGDVPGGRRLPPADQRGAGPAAVHVRNLSGVRVLYVDDEEPVRRMVAMMLERLMATATVVSSPLEALRLVREDEDRFDVLVTDLAMPEMSGDQLVVRVREVSSALPVVVVSGDALNGKIEACLEQGAQRFLAKPFTMAGFARAIHEACHPGRLAS